MPQATAAAPQTNAGSAGGYVDPFRAYNFKLEIQGVTQGHFTECSGTGIKIHPIRYREGGTNEVVHVMPGQVEYADITLRYGLTASSELWVWFMTAVKGKVERKNVSILLLDSEGTAEVMRWNLINAWPAQWRGTVLDTLSHEVAIEELTLVFETLDRG